MLQRFKVIRQLCGKRDISVALDLKQHRRVVLKRHEHLDCFRAELQSLERLRGVVPDHPNAHLVRHAESCPETQTIVFPYIRGRDMLDNLTWMRKYQKRAMNEKESRNWMQAAHSCIAALQDHNLVHLDVKMENFVITPRVGHGNDVTLIDVQTVKTAPMKQYSILPEYCGTQLYQSPEANINRRYHRNTDLWGLGLCGFIICQGSHPFQRSDITYKNIQSFVHDNLDSMSAEYRDTVTTLLSNNPDERSYAPLKDA